MTARRFITVALVATAVAACSGGQAPTPATSASPGTGPAASPSAAPSGSPSVAPSPTTTNATLLLKVTTEGGFINPSATLAALPTVAVYTDGRILTPAPVDAIYPGPLVLALQVRDVGPSGATAILAAVKAARLDVGDSGTPGVQADTGATVFTVVIDGNVSTTRIGGGAPRPGRPGGSLEGAGVAPALGLLDRLLDPAETWGGRTSAETQYEPTGYLIYVAPSGSIAQPDVSQPAVAWPLAVGLDAFGVPAVPDRGVAGLRRGVVLGSDAARLAPILQAAKSITPFTSGGHSYTLWVRPLLPDESGS